MKILSGFFLAEFGRIDSSGICFQQRMKRSKSFDIQFRETVSIIYHYHHTINSVTCNARYEHLIEQHCIFFSSFTIQSDCIVIMQCAKCMMRHLKRLSYFFKKWKKADSIYQIQWNQQSNFYWTLWTNGNSG